MTVACCAALSGAAAAQQRPELAVTLAGRDAMSASVRARGLLGDRVIGALESGFPLYVEYRVALREARGLFDRTVGETVWGFVVLHDPVRDVFVAEDPDGTEEFGARDLLRRRVERVYLVVDLAPDGPGTFYYRATLTARTLSDADVDEAFAWLKGDAGDSARLRQPGPITRAARRVLVRVAPLPRITLEERTPGFVRR